MTQLFRREAIDYAGRRLAGDVVLASSWSLRLLSIFAGTVIVGALIFVSVATYARKETVSGWLTPDKGMIRLTARQTGVLESLMVHEGDWVTEGQPVATLRLSDNLDSGDPHALLAGTLDAQAEAARLAARSELQALIQERALLSDREQALGQELAEAARQVALQRERLILATTDAERARLLADRGFLPRRRLEEILAARLTADQQLSQMTAASLSIERQINETRARLAAIPNDVGAARARAETTSALLDQQRTDAARQAEAVITATVSGQISTLPVQVGQTVIAGSAVAIVIPNGSQLQAELYVPSRSSGFVREGQEVRLLYQAYPYQKFGAGSGTVRSVSRTVLAPSELAIPGMRFDEPVFRVRVQLDRDHVFAYGERLPLQPGMMLTADVVIDRRSLAEWLFDPLFAAGRR